VSSGMRMKISEVALTPLALPRKHPHVHRFGVLTTHEHLLVSVRLDDGTEGYAEASPKPWNPGGETMATVVSVLRDLLAPAVIGQDASRLDDLHNRIRLVNGNPMARSALEMAVLDAYGRALGEPVHRLLGGFATSVPCAALLSWGDPETVAAEAVQARDRLGVQTFKLKIGIDLDKDVAIVAAVREAVGADSVLYADGNRAYSFHEARQFLRRIPEGALDWVEEPCESAGSLGRRAFVASAPIPVLGDESCADAESALDAMLGGRSTMLSIKPARTGVRASLRIRDMAHALGIEVLVGSSGESALGTFTTAAIAAAGMWTTRHAAELLMYQDLAADLVTELPTITDGELIIPDRPGFGFDVDAGQVGELSSASAIVIRESDGPDRQ
jgi:o-succinylbenzoate synthase